jgi:hypothetical protein
MIAFTQSATAGMLDRQQTIKPGRFLRQHLPDASDEQIKQFAAACLGALSAGIHHSADADEFARIYMNGPSSCMSYGQHDKKFGGLMVDGEFYHPARVYAHPDNDIEIIWLEVAGRIGARAVVNTANKQYPTLYGSDSVSGAVSRLRGYLDTLGYEEDSYALDGQKLLKMYTDDGAIVCPYIDAGNRGVNVNDDHLLVGGQYEANHETGCLIDFPGNDSDWYCDHCGDGQEDYDDRHNTADEEQVCTSCASRHYTEAYCADTENSVWVPDNSCDLQTDLSPRNRNGRIYTGDGWGDYRCLSELHYNNNCVAHYEHVTECESGDYVLDIDIDRLGLFTDDNGEACEISEYAVFDDDLVPRSRVPDDAVICTDESDDDYPMLPVYRSVEEEDQEDAA